MSMHILLAFVLAVALQQLLLLPLSLLLLGLDTRQPCFHQPCQLHCCHESWCHHAGPYPNPLAAIGKMRTRLKATWQSWVNSTVEGISLHNAAQHGKAEQGRAQHGTVWHSVAQHGTA